MGKGSRTKRCATMCVRPSWASRAARQGYELDVELLGEISALTRGLPAEEAPQWREDLALVGGLGPTGGFLISSPPGPELVAATAQWCSWVASERGMPVVCKVALGFYQAVVLSPMPGSDHAARLWPTMELIRRGILPDQILPFTDWFEGQQSEFQRHLRGVIDRLDLDSWVRFVATVIQRACRDQLRQIAELVQTGDELAGPYVHTTRAAQLVQELIGNPIINAARVAQRLGISERYARTLLNRLLRDGVLEVVDSKHRGRIYRCRRVLQVYGLIQKTAADSDYRAFAE